jgi:hypothetical protein
MRRFVADVAHFLFSAVGLQPVVTRVVAMNSGGWRYNVRKRDPVDTHAGKLQEEDVYRTRADAHGTCNLAIVHVAAYTYMYLNS